ncbi:hypothetical protein [Methylosinus sp. PW1]|uniref:hypothetical protein n=1 Tax=Methylosinus sp. PW1 TaxID=107636 RepID=UPI00068D99F2|nr:hypothetical protein [Methylosinus sp. PW1]
MTSPTYGLIFNRDDTDPRPAQASDLSVIGLVLPSDDARADFLPLNEPVAFDSGDPVALAKIGTGDLYKAVTAIDDQLADLQTSARIVAVRVAAGGNDAAMIANIIGARNGSSANGHTGTGIYALLRAGSQAGVIPRLIGAPGYTWQTSASGGSTDVSRATKAGGNTGNGAMTLASPAFLAGVQAGVYQVRCIGGARSAASAAKSGNTGNGVVSGLAANAAAAVGVWRAIFDGVATNGGAFAVVRPDGTFDGVGVVGVAYSSASAPGLSFTIGDGATDFVAGDEFDITVAAAVPANGGVFSVTDPHGVALANATVGAAYATQIGFTIADGATDFAIGDGFDVTVSIVDAVITANPICAALPSVLNALLAHSIVGGPGTGVANAIAWEESLGSGRLIPIDAWTVVSDGVNTRYEDGVARALGLAVRTDFLHGGYPFWSFAGQQMRGIVGLKTYYSFSLVDGATEGQELLAAHIGVVERGEVGVETAIASNGFVFAGLWNADTDPNFWFYNKSRGRDWAHLALLKSIRLRLGVDNVTSHGVQAVLNDMTAIGQEALLQEGSIGFRVGFESSRNSPTDLRQGKFRVFFQSEEPAPIAQVTIDSRPYYEALVEELATLVTQSATIVGQFA